MMIERADVSTFPRARALLVDAHLPVDDLDPNRVTMFVAVDADRRVVGCVGIELHGDVALLRSLAVHESKRKQGLGEQLCTHALNEAITHGATRVVALTTTASSFFSKRGFDVVTRDRLPHELNDHPQVTSLCPSTATVLTWSPRSTSGTV